MIGWLEDLSGPSEEIEAEWVGNLFGDRSDCIGNDAGMILKAHLVDPLISRLMSARPVGWTEARKLWHAKYKEVRGAELLSTSLELARVQDPLYLRTYPIDKIDTLPPFQHHQYRYRFLIRLIAAPAGQMPMVEVHPFNWLQVCLYAEATQATKYMFLPRKGSGGTIISLVFKDNEGYMMASLAPMMLAPSIEPAATALLIKKLDRLGLQGRWCNQAFNDERKEGDPRPWLNAPEAVEVDQKG